MDVVVTSDVNEAKTDEAKAEARTDEAKAEAEARTLEAEAKAAEAARLHDRAAAHQTEAATSREQLQEQWQRAEHMDPKTRKGKTEGSTPDGEEAWGRETSEPPTDNYRETDTYRGAPT